MYGKLSCRGVEPHGDEQQDREGDERRASVAHKRQRNAHHGHQADGHAHVDQHVEQQDRRHAVAVDASERLLLPFAHAHQPQDQQAQQKTQEVANQVAADQQQQDQQQAADQQQQQDQQQTPTETEQKAWVYATETMNIRQEPNEQSAVLASALQGSELRQLAVTSDGWSKVKTGDIVGYVKTEYVTTQHP